MSLFQRLLNTLRPGHAARERAEEEARFHLEMRAADLQRDGLSPQEARAEARRAFGNVTALQEETGDRDVLLQVEAWLRDGKVAWRRLRSSPVFFASSILLLAFGVGVNAAVFSVVDQLFLRPLPLPNPERLVLLNETRGTEKSNSNPIRIRDWAARIPAFQSVMGSYGEIVPLETNEGKRGIRVTRTVGDFMGTLGSKPVEGRNFTAEEQRGASVAILLERGRGLGKLNGTLRLSGEVYTIVGVASNNVSLGEEVFVLTPAPASVQGASRTAGFLPVVARLKPGSNLNQAQQQASAAARQMAQEFPASDQGLGASLEDLQSAYTAEARGSGWLLQAACLLLLFITLFNLGALFAARTAARQKESAIRGFLGATSFTNFRLHFAEALLLSGLGSAAAVLVASWSLTALKEAFRDSYEPIQVVELDWRVLLFLGALGLASSLFFAAVMSWQSAQAKRTHAPGRPWLRAALIVAEATLGVLLLGAAFRLALEFADRQSRPMGFTTQDVVTARIDLPWSADLEEITTAIERGQERFAALPGVSSVGVVDRLPLAGGTQSGKVLVQGRAETPTDEIGFRMASPSYFATLGIPLLSGTPLGEKGTVLVNDVFARRFLGGQAIGRYISRDAKTPKWLRVVGVVGSVRAAASEAEPRPEVWVHYSETYWPKLEFVLRTNQPAANLAGPIRKITSELSPTALLDSVVPLESRLAKLDREPRQKRDIVLLFGFLALALIITGVYGVIAGELNRRTREIGIRLAIGARPYEVAALLLQQSAQLAAVTLALSIPLSAYWLSEQIPVRLVLASAAAISLAMLSAGFLPAWRATRIQANEALRVD
jgi:predicted permease